MKLARPKAFAAAGALIAAGALTMILLPSVSYDERVGFAASLPERIGPFTALAPRYCHNDQCRRPDHLLADLDDPDTCPSCSSPLYDRSLAEKLLLPEDTVILKRLYRDPAGKSFFASAVLTGRERRSIHNPEVCLTSGGYRILEERYDDVPIEGRAPLRVRLLRLRNPGPAGRAGETFYAYWFVTHGRETPSHLERLAWMAWDSIRHGVRRRWAYLAVSVSHPSLNERELESLRLFIAEFERSMAGS